jgi:hypothetical protein
MRTTVVKTLLIASVLLLGAANTAPGRIITVDNDGPADFNNIQAAINDANDGDVVEVQPGVYTGEGNRDIDFLGKAITVCSTDPNDRAVVADTIIDCNGSHDDPHRGFRFHNEEGANSIVDGMTITNGAPWFPCPLGEECMKPDVAGGAIQCHPDSYPAEVWPGPTVRNCIIAGNSARYGGGIYGCKGPIVNCAITDNWAGSGGGLLGCSGPIVNCNISGNFAAVDGGGLSYCIGPIMNCTISHNWAGQTGGGLASHYGGTSISNCILTGNSVKGSGDGMGGAIYCLGDGPTIANCTVTGNLADYGGGIFCHGDSTPTIDDCIFWDNTATSGSEVAAAAYQDPPWGPFPPPPPEFPDVTISHCDIEGGQDAAYVEEGCTLVWAAGNINADPCFVAAGYWVDGNDPNIVVEPNDPNAFWVDGDYHLLTGSLCIDAGDPNYVPEPNETDLDGKPRVVGGRIDMGAYEFVPAIECQVAFLPRVINRHSRGKRIIGLMLLPEGVTKDQIDSSQRFVLDPGGIEAMFQMIVPHSRRRTRRTMVVCFFERDALLAAVPDNGRTRLRLAGSLTDGRRCYGSGIVWIRSGRRPGRFWWSSFWPR